MEKSRLQSPSGTSAGMGGRCTHGGPDRIQGSLQCSESQGSRSLTVIVRRTNLCCKHVLGSRLDSGVRAERVLWTEQGIWSLWNRVRILALLSTRPEARDKTLGVSGPRLPLPQNGPSSSPHVVWPEKPQPVPGPLWTVIR